MLRMLLFIHHIAFCTSCIASLPLAHIRSFTLDHVEPGLKVQAECTQVKESTNLALDQGKPWCIYPVSLSFIYNYILIMILECALGYRSWVDALAALS
jgi:hypothetical protein